MRAHDKIVDSFDVVEQVISHHGEISYFHVLDVPTPPPLQERVRHEFLDPSAIQSAIELKRRYGLSFWDAYFVVFQENPANTKEVFCAALLHDRAASRLRQLKTEDAFSLRQLEQETNPGQMLALSSLVKLRNGEVRHIPMLDFHCTASVANLSLAVSALRALTGSSHGLLLESTAFNS
jgi:hypothetical protein